MIPSGWHLVGYNFDFCQIQEELLFTHSLIIGNIPVHPPCRCWCCLLGGAQLFPASPWTLGSSNKQKNRKHACRTRHCWQEPKKTLSFFLCEGHEPIEVSFSLQSFRADEKWCNKPTQGKHTEIIIHAVGELNSHLQHPFWDGTTSPGWHVWLWKWWPKLGGKNTPWSWMVLVNT